MIGIERSGNWRLVQVTTYRMSIDEYSAKIMHIKYVVWRLVYFVQFFFDVLPAHRHVAPT